jgi:dienelactone hydrolase
MDNISRRTLMLSAGGAIFSGLTAKPQDNLTPLYCSASDATISCFQPFDFKDSKGRTHRVFAAGEGPPVVVLHELPGLTPPDILLGKMLINKGYTALVPLLFGYPGDDRFAHNLFQVCGKDQFDCSASGSSPRALEWIHEFCTSVHDIWKEGAGVGVVGMCLTGEFPLALLRIDSVKGAVLCQPTNPFNVLTLVHLGKGTKIGLSNCDLELARKSKIPILGIRYTGDAFCPAARFDTLGRMFPGQFFRMDLPGHHHSSLGKDFSSVAFDEVVRYFGQQLKNIPPSEETKFPCHAKPADSKAASTIGACKS